MALFANLGQMMACINFHTEEKHKSYTSLVTGERQTNLTWSWDISYQGSQRCKQPRSTCFLNWFPQISAWRAELLSSAKTDGSDKSCYKVDLLFSDVICIIIIMFTISLSFKSWILKGAEITIPQRKKNPLI